MQINVTQETKPLRRKISNLFQHIPSDYGEDSMLLKKAKVRTRGLRPGRTSRRLSSQLRVQEIIHPYDSI